MTMHPSRRPYSLVPHYRARKSPLGELLIWTLVRTSLQRMFVRARLRELAGNPRAAQLPLILVANHPSWWDGYLALLLSRHYGARRYLMMDAAQLTRYGFFAWAGCFGVERADARDVARSIAYAADLLRQAEPMWLWLFPQAEITPARARPLSLHAGAAHIVRRATAGGRTVGVLPVAWELVFRGEQHPEVILLVGDVITFDAECARDVLSVTANLSAALAAVMDAVGRDIARDDFAGYRTILRGRAGVNDRFDRLLRRDRLVADP
ncbi:MAG: lysophospholipid acyltransferase family protein [Thermomicrobiales bacterium]